MPSKEHDTKYSLRHPILVAAGCPDSGNGAQVFLQFLASALERCVTLKIGASAADWLRESRLLAQSVVDLPGSPSPTAEDLASPIWGGIHGCIIARRGSLSQSNQSVDGLLALMILNACTGRREITQTALQGVKNCYTALASIEKLSEGWRLLANVDLLNAAAVENILKATTHPPARKFALLVLGYLASSMPTFASIAATAPINPSDTSTNPVNTPTDPHSPWDTSDALLDTASTEALDQNSTVERADASLKRIFQRGDSVIEWQRQVASYRSRNNRLALESWQSLPTDETCRVAARLSVFLADPDSPNHKPSIIALGSLLTSTPPHVLLHAPLCSGTDIVIDLDNACFKWTMPLLRENGNVSSTATKPEPVRIPFPQAWAAAVARVREGLGSRLLQYFGDLFDVDPNSAAWQMLLGQVEGLLKQVSDPAYPAFPGRWSNSISRVYLESCGSDLTASTCSLDLGLAPSAALYYFHPSPLEIRAVVQMVYDRLGLGLAVEAGTFTDEDVSPIPSDLKLTDGFKRLRHDYDATLRKIISQKSDLRTAITYLNELTILTASLLVFLVGGRGSRIGEVTFGAIFSDPECLWIEDKRVPHESSSRIVPKPSILSQALDQWLRAIRSVAERIAAHLPRDRAEKWKEITAGTFRFDAVAFESLEMQGKAVRRRPLEAAHVESVAQKYFAAPRNFMRHALVTRWAIVGEDRDLLRLLTGHASAGLAMPAVGAVYSPASAVHAARSILDHLLGKWVDGVEQGSKGPANVQFVALPGRRIFKVHGAHRDHLDQCGSTVFSQFHLAATCILSRLRNLLLEGQGPSKPLARLWLHLAAFDALHEEGDLRFIFSDLTNSIQRGSRGWIISWARSDAAPGLQVPAQIPTSVLLTNHFRETLHENVDYETVLRSAGEWLGATMPDVWSLPRGKDASTTASALLAAVSLWVDWQLPPALQYCYCPSSNAPLLDSSSSAELYSDSASMLPPTPPAQLSAAFEPGKWMDTLYRAINSLGSSRHRFGERKRRAALFARWVASIKFPRGGELACYLMLAVEVNVKRVRESRKDAIEFSSVATYLSSLKRFLLQNQSCDPDLFDQLDWREFCQELYSFATSEDAGKTAAEEAAKWLLGCWRTLGYLIPSIEALEHRGRHPRPSTPTAIASVSPNTWDRAATLWRSIEQPPIDQARLNVCALLLRVLPLRWGEIAALKADDFTQWGEMCIRPFGFSHLKSYSGTRRLAVEDSILTQVSDVVRQIEAQCSLGREDHMLLGSAKDKSGTIMLTSSWINQYITAHVQAVSGNPGLRIHSLRADSVSSLLYPEWRSAISSYVCGELSPARAKEIFDYVRDRAWRTDRARLAAGHAGIATTLGFYFHAWLPLRCLALHATLFRLRPSKHVLAGVNVSDAAMAKAIRRSPVNSIDGWQYVLNTHQKLMRDGGGSLSKDEGSATSSTLSTDSPTAEVAPPPQQETPAPVWSFSAPSLIDSSPALHVTYIALRLLGLTPIDTSNSVGLPDSGLVLKLEEKLKLGLADARPLRARIRGSIDGRAHGADIKMIRSGPGQSLIPVIAAMPLTALDRLADLLVSRHGVLEWEQVLRDCSEFLAESVVCLEVVFDRRHMSIDVCKRVSSLAGLVIGSPAFDVGPLPRVFAQPRAAELRNTVAKARWTTLIRVLCQAVRVLNHPTHLR